MLTCRFTLILAVVLLAAPLGEVRAEQNPPTAGVVAPAAGPDEKTQIARFAQALELLRSNYNGPVDVDSLTSAALKGMAGSLDGHSTYMTAEEYKDFQAGATGEFAGIGTVIEIDDGKLRVIAPTDTGPAARAGVSSGWLIRTIDGQTTDRITLMKATRLLRGGAGTKVAVTFVNGEGRDVPLVLTRETIHLHSVYQRRIGDVGYIHITGFAQSTDRELAEAQAALLKDGHLGGLILDLRNNTGGFIDAAVQVASRFLRPGDIVVRTGKSVASTSAIVASDKGSELRTLPVAVLINGGSASAAEIVAAALQDNRRATLVGLTTFGKGLVQTIFPIADGSEGAISVTTMRYYAPSGRSIQITGVNPDIAAARTAREAEAAVKNVASFTEASIYNTPENEMKLQRLVPEVVEGPVRLSPAPDKPLFNQPVPDDAAIEEDFQVQRALNVLRSMGVHVPGSDQPSRAYRRSLPVAKTRPGKT